MSSVRTYAVRISNVAYGRNNESRKVIITFGEEIEERLKRNKIDYIYAEPSPPYFSKTGSYVKFYGFNSAEGDVPFMNNKFWAKYDFRTHSIRYASKAIVKIFDPFLGEYSDFIDNKLSDDVNKAKYELFHIRYQHRSGYSIVSSRRGSTMSIAPGERRVTLDYDEKTEERIKEVNSISEQQEQLAKDLAAVIKVEQKDAYEDILKRKSNLAKEESKNAFLEHHPLDLDADANDEFVPATNEAYRREFFADWAADFELFPHEKTVQKDIEGIMGCLEKEMDDYRDRLTKLTNRYHKLDMIYIALTGHRYGDDMPKELYVMPVSVPGDKPVSDPGGNDGKTKEPVPYSVPV